MNLNTKLYHGRRRTSPGPTVVVDDGQRGGFILRHGRSVPDWNWGPEAQPEKMETLAQAILMHTLNDEAAAVELAPAFSREVVAEFPDAGFTLADWQIEAWLQVYSAKR